MRTTFACEKSASSGLDLLAYFLADINEYAHSEWFALRDRKRKCYSLLLLYLFGSVEVLPGGHREGFQARKEHHFGNYRSSV